MKKYYALAHKGGLTRIECMNYFLAANFGSDLYDISVDPRGHLETKTRKSRER